MCPVPTAEFTLEERITCLEHNRNALAIVTAAALILPFLPAESQFELVLHNAAGVPTIALPGEIGTVELHGLSTHNDLNKVRAAFVPTVLGAEITLFNSVDEPVAVFNNSSPGQGGRLSLFGMGNRAAFFGGTVTDDDFGMEIRMRPGVSAVTKTLKEVPFFFSVGLGRRSPDLNQEWGHRAVHQPCQRSRPRLGTPCRDCWRRSRRQRLPPRPR